MTAKTAAAADARPKSASAVRLPAVVAALGACGLVLLLSLSTASPRPAKPGQAQPPSMSEDAKRGIAPKAFPKKEMMVPPRKPCRNSRKQKCREEVLVPGFPYSRTSLAVRLLVLMGAWAGNDSSLFVEEANPLEGWFRRDVERVERVLLEKYGSQDAPSWTGMGFDARRVAAMDWSRFARNARVTAEDLNSHRPWVLGVPRFAFTADLWLDFVDKPVCAVAYRHPAQLALQLAQGDGSDGWAGSGADLVRAGAGAGPGSTARRDQQYNIPADRYIWHWEDYMIRTMLKCVQMPTIVLPMDLAEPATLGAFMGVLELQLRAAGVSGALRAPQVQALREGVLEHWQEEAALHAGRAAARQRQRQRQQQAAGKQQAGKQQAAGASAGSSSGSGSSNSSGSVLPEEEFEQWLAACRHKWDLEDGAQPPPLWPHGCSVSPGPYALGFMSALDLLTHTMLTEGRVLKPVNAAGEVLGFVAAYAEAITSKGKPKAEGS